MAAARPGATCESVDAAARKVITDAGFGPGYKVPGLPHRTGHGIGLDGHEWTYLVKGNKTRLQPGMCFSNEPTIAIYGEFGVRLEDCMYITGERRAHVHEAEPGDRSAVRINHATDHAKTIDAANRETAGRHEGVRTSGRGARARPRHDVPHGSALGKERAHLRGGAAGEGRAGLGAARLRRDARARADPPGQRRYPRLAGGREPVRAHRRRA